MLAGPPLSKASALSGGHEGSKPWLAVLTAQAYDVVKPSLRWLYSTNAKDIGTMYLAYSLFTGLIGLAFSVLLRMELSSPGNQYLAGNHHLYNVVVTTHGIVDLLPYPKARLADTQRSCTA
jgi:hypothetical protein